MYNAQLQAVDSRMTGNLCINFTNDVKLAKDSGASPLLPLPLVVHAIYSFHTSKLNQHEQRL